MLSCASTEAAYGGDCGAVNFTEHLFDKVKTTAEWRLAHMACLTDDETFDLEPFHPSDVWFWLRCRCGARHLCDVVEIEVRH